MISFGQGSGFVEIYRLSRKIHFALQHFSVDIYVVATVGIVFGAAKYHFIVPVIVVQIKAGKERIPCFFGGKRSNPVGNSHAAAVNAGEF